MTTLTITIPDHAKTKLSDFVEEIGGEVVNENKTSVTKPVTKKTKLLAEIQTGLKEVKAIKDGKLKAYSMDDLLNDK